MMFFLHFFTFYNCLIFSICFVSSVAAILVDFLSCVDLCFFTIYYNQV